MRVREIKRKRERGFVRVGDRHCVCEREREKESLRERERKRYLSRIKRNYS